MIAVLFEAWPRPGQAPRYFELAALLRPALDGIDGFVSIERFQSLANPAKLLSLSWWRDEAAIAAWRNLPAHRATQAEGRVAVFDDYRLRIVVLARDYGMHDRAQAPADSLASHSGAAARSAASARPPCVVPPSPACRRPSG